MSFWAMSFEVWLIKYRRFCVCARARARFCMYLERWNFHLKKNLFLLLSQDPFPYTQSISWVDSVNDSIFRMLAFMDRSLSLRDKYFLVLFPVGTFHLSQIFRTSTYFVR